MADSFIRSRIEGNLLLITLARAEKRNALTPQMVHDLAAAVANADAHPEIRAVIVSAEGPVFSAGVDLLSLAQGRAEAGQANPGRWLRRFAGDLQTALDRIEATEVPVIGALHGQVMGLGVELALAFDLRVASDELKLSMPEARMGLVADVGGTTRLTRLVGPSRAKDLLMTCRAIDAQEALGWGLVNRVVPAAELMPRCVELARQIAANAPLAVGMAKRIIDQGAGLDAHSSQALERWSQAQLIATEDVIEATSAFFEKRPPRFQGR
jgi:enoyl-CoA hydratase/carnithine racemase